MHASPGDLTPEAAEVPEPDWDPRSQERKAFASFAQLTRTKRMLEQELDRIKDELDALALQLRDFLGESGYEKVRIDGFTIFIRREIYARKYDWASAAEVCAVLKANGMGHFVKEQYNTQTLSKHIRELEYIYAAQLARGEIESVKEKLPPALARVLNIEPSYKVVALET